MTGVSAPTVSFNDDRYIVQLGPGYSHLQENILEHLAILPQLAESIEPRRLILDMREVKFMGSAFMGLLVHVSRKLTQRNGSLALKNTNKFCQTVIQLAGLASIIPVETAQSLVSAD